MIREASFPQSMGNLSHLLAAIDFFFQFDSFYCFVKQKQTEEGNYITEVLAMTP